MSQLTRILLSSVSYTLSRETWLFFLPLTYKSSAILYDLSNALEMISLSKNWMAICKILRMSKERSSFLGIALSGQDLYKSEITLRRISSSIKADDILY